MILNLMIITGAIMIVMLLITGIQHFILTKNWIKILRQLLPILFAVSSAEKGMRINLEPLNH